MFQTFDDIADPTKGPPRVARLRAELARRKLKGFLVPRADEHQGEYVPPHAERLAWLTGFSGSAGLAVVLADRAAVFVDGRYTLQVRDQVDTDLFETLQTPEHRPSKWLADALEEGDTVGYDPRLHSIKAIERLETALKPTGAVLAAQDSNPVDAIWEDQPPPPAEPVVPHPIALAGVPASEKIAEAQKTLREAKADAAVLTLPDSIAWLFNIRGGDVGHTPLPLSFALLPAEGRPALFIDPRKLSDNVRGHLAETVEIAAPEALEARLAEIGASGARVRLDAETASRWIGDTLKAAGAEIVEGQDPCVLPKARKNAAEIAGTRAAHLRDGAAVCRFLAWLDARGASGEIDEIAAAEQLETFRRETGALKDISFDTISGAGPNGAIVHYRVTQSTSRTLEPGSLYLVDSGAQYADGTTDITRTVAIGDPTDEMRRHFTLVLKGHIAIATARFPKGTRGQDLDPFARRALWAAGLDFDHGTGHGVGSYLSVHEGPQRISRLGTVPLEPGMIVSNEPGYYREGEYGIRIENLVLVTELAPVDGGDREMMAFETLTLAPIDRRLVDAGLLTAEETAWLDTYHARVQAEIGPSLDGDDADWLRAASRPLVVG